MKSLKYLLLIATLLTVLPLTACGGDKTPDETLPATDPSSETAPETVPDSTEESASDTAIETVPESEAYDESEPETVPPLVIPDDALHVTAHGITAGAGHAMENSLALLPLLNDLPDGSTLYFPEGTYEIAFPMFLVGKQNIRIVGDNAILLRTGTVNTVPAMSSVENDAIPEAYRALTGSTGFLGVTDTQGFTLEGLTFRYDTPTSLSGKVVSVSGGSAVIELTDGSAVTGGEYATVINTFTADGIPDRVLEQYAETSFSVEKLDDKTIRVSGLAPGGASNLKKGTRVCLRLCTGRDYIINCLRATDLVFRNITMNNSYNGGIILTERCGNVTLDHVRVDSDNPEALMSLNADAVHIADMIGTLDVTNCTFDRPGDDCINVHSGAYVVEAVDGNTVTMASPRFGNPPVWSLPGDTLAFYYPATFSVVATAKVMAVNGKVYTMEEFSGVTVGCVVSNIATRPIVTVRNTTASNTRARGFLLQTDKATVENCTFKGTALAAILVASDVDVWYEMSPTRELTIQNNTFESCGHHAAGVIQITASHDNPNKTYDRSIHGRIDIMGNTFASLRTPAVYALCTYALTVKNNAITAKGYRDAYLWVVSCETVYVSGIEEERIVSDRVDFLVTA